VKRAGWSSLFFLPPPLPVRSSRLFFLFFALCHSNFARFSLFNFFSPSLPPSPPSSQYSLSLSLFLLPLRCQIFLVSRSFCSSWSAALTYIFVCVPTSKLTSFRSADCRSVCDVKMWWNSGWNGGQFECWCFCTVSLRFLSLNKKVLATRQSSEWRESSLVYPWPMCQRLRAEMGPDPSLLLTRCKEEADPGTFWSDPMRFFLTWREKMRFLGKIF